MVYKESGMDTLSSNHDEIETQIPEPNFNKSKNENKNSDIVNNKYTAGNELPVKVPIVGFETMEERAKFTVFKLRVENEKLDESWLVFRRYTDFVRLHSKLKDEVLNLEISLPPKRWLRDNFDTAFLEERTKGLQAFVDSILFQPYLAALPTVRRFFCLDEPPVYSDTAEESRSWYGTIEDSAIMLKHKLSEKDREVELLRAELALVTAQRDNILKVARNCRHCNQKQLIMSACSNLKDERIVSNSILSNSAIPSSSSSSDHSSCSPRRTFSLGESHQQQSVIHKNRNSPSSSRKSSINDSPSHRRRNEEETLSSLNEIPEASLVSDINNRVVSESGVTINALLENSNSQSIVKESTISLSDSSKIKEGKSENF